MFDNSFNYIFKVSLQFFRFLNHTLFDYDNNCLFAHSYMVSSIPI